MRIKKIIFGKTDGQAPVQIFFSENILQGEKHFYFCAEQSFNLIQDFTLGTPQRQHFNSRR